MICPNCKTETKPDAKFCHVCGFPLESENEQKQVYENVDVEVQSSGTTNEKKSANQSIDLSKITKDEWIFVGLSGLGAVGCLLPWAHVSLMWFSQSVSGVRAWQGTFSLILFLGLIVFVLLKDILRIEPSQEKQVKTAVHIAVPALIILLTLISFIDILTTQYVGLSIGIFIALGSAVLLLLMGIGIVKFVKK